jgi:hypothetical protein
MVDPLSPTHSWAGPFGATIPECEKLARFLSVGAVGRQSDKKLVNLTEMWRAWQEEEGEKDAGVIRAHRPAEFKRIHETIKFMEYLKKILKVGEAHLWIAAKGKYGETYAHRAKPAGRYAGLWQIAPVSTLTCHT